MCTAITYYPGNHYFGRNLDLEYSYEESITITPRNYPFLFRMKKKLEHHYAMIGMAYVYQDYPLYYDATNEWGLSMAALSFDGNACYHPYNSCKDNVTPYEFILYVLGQCRTIKEVEKLIRDLNIVDLPVSDSLQNTPLHWMISDKERSITIESVKEGFRIHENPVGVLTNNPDFPWQITNLNQYMALSPRKPKNNLAIELNLTPFSRGMGAMGLPGDYSSPSRFVKACFVKMNAQAKEEEEDGISQFFHILGAVEQVRGCVKVGEDQNEFTVYSSCVNMDRGIYYYKTYGNSRITAIDMGKEDLEQIKLVSYPLLKKQDVRYQN